MSQHTTPATGRFTTKDILAAMVRASESAKATALATGTKVYVSDQGRVVPLKLKAAK